MAGSRPVLEVDAPRDSIKSTGGIVPVADKTSPAWRSQAGGRDSLSNYAAVMQGTQISSAGVSDVASRPSS
jgi:hypothetical protein